jgi:membrane protein DedA with SNARE-associated domain/membrane-associated phospholipid phosphatase
MMAEALNPILQWLNIHPHMAGLATFLISAAESIAIIGTIVPGTIMMTAIGALAGVGVIPLWSTIWWAIIGAIVGDNLSFFIGHHFKDGLRECWPFRRYPTLLGSGEKFFLKYGIMSVFIGRFIGPVRALVPIVAGMLRMKPIRYVTVSIIASICWAPIYMLPGILLGEAALEFPPDVAVHVVIVLLFSFLFIALCCWLVYKSFVLVRSQVNHLLTTIWERLKRSRYFYIFTLVLQHNNPAKTHGQLTLAFYFLVTCAAFLYLAFYIHYNNPADILVNNVLFYLFRSWRTPALDNLMLYVTLIGDKKVLLPAVLGIVMWLAYLKRWNTFWHALALLVLTCGGIVVFKHLVHSDRPWGILHSPETYSFPSGHTTFAMVFFIATALLLTQNQTRRWKRIIYFFTGLLVGIISISRIYLGAHWFTDVLGGWLLSSALLMFIAISFNRLPEQRFSTKRLSALVIMTIFLGASLQYVFLHGRLTDQYLQQDWPTYTIQLNTWWEQDGDHLPLTRVGRLGVTAELFNLQWIGDLSDIEKTLQDQGWEKPADENLTRVLHRIGDVSSAEHFPLVSPLYLDKKPVLVLVKHANGDKKLVVLRLWKSNIIIDNVKQPFWVGSVGVAPRTYSWLIHYKKNNLDVTPVLIFNTVPDSYEVKEIAVSVHVKRKHRWQQQPMILIKPKSLLG